MNHHKPHLILVHSFPTNSVLLEGLGEFLADYFTVHFVDLPGFHVNSPPLKGKITLQKFSDYLDKQIAAMDVDEYVVGGISFGFLVVNNAKLDQRCKAILAMEPYLNVRCLNVPRIRQKKYVAMAAAMKSLSPLRLEDKIWRSRWFKEYLRKAADYPKERIAIVSKHVDARTFFTVAAMLLTYNKDPKFHDLPYFLVGNFEDRTINFERVVEIFLRHVKELHIASEPLDHYPKEVSKRYFTRRVPKEHITRLIACMEAGDEDRTSDGTLMRRGLPGPAPP